MLIYLEDIKCEADMVDVIDEVENEVIEAQCTNSNKYQKIVKVKETVAMLTTKCVIRKWKDSNKKLNKMNKALEAAKVECKENTGNLSPYYSRL